MSTSSKFDLSSNSPDRVLYNTSTNQRGSYVSSSSLDRSNSFRENMESPILSSSAIQNIPRNSTNQANQGDVLSFLQCLRFDPKSMIGEHKLNRPIDFKRLTASAIGISLEDSGSSKSKVQISPSLEDLRRLKNFLGVSCSKARERTKIFSEASSVIIKCFPSPPSKKRSRIDALSHDRMGKMGIQNHASTSGFEIETQKEERIKPNIPNKRTRTSMVESRSDIRGNTPIRLPNSNSGQSEDRSSSLSIGVETWEKSKMKKKRSTIKQDISSNLVASKPIEGYRDIKQRNLNDTRPRLGDTHGFRGNTSNGGVKSEGNSVNIGMRSSIRNDPDRPIGLEKERVNPKAVNKSDFSSGSPITAPRAPRSSATSILPKATQRPIVTNEWEISHCNNNNNNKLSIGVNNNNKKRSVSARSSSPPVAQWAGQRAQTVIRTPRRSNFSPILPSDELTVSINSPSQVKGKSESFSSVLSESEESETKKNKKIGADTDIDEKGGANVQKMSTLLLPPRKIKDENIGDGVRRQGRTGRSSFTSGRAHNSLAIEKNSNNAGTAKQLRTKRLGIDKTESKTGRPLTRKVSDRKAYARQKHTTVNTPTDFLVGSDDGHEELLSATNAVINPGQALSSPTWKEMEPYFRYISDVDLVYIKKQITPELDISEGFEAIKLPKEIPLYQRLMAALIPEEETNNNNNNEKINDNDEETLLYNGLDNFESFDQDLGSNGYMIPNNTFLSINESKNIQNYNNNNRASNVCSEDQYINMPLNGRLSLELQSVGIFPEEVPELSQTEDEEISKDINSLYEKYQQLVLPKKARVGNLLKSATEANELQKREFEKKALDKLVGMAYEKYMSCWGRNGIKSGSGKIAKQGALAFVKRTLEKYKEYEVTGKSRFGESVYMDKFLSSVNTINNSNTTTNSSPGLIIGSPEVGLDKVKKIADVGTGNGSGSSGTCFANNAKGKRSGKSGRGNVKGERKSKPKPKQKNSQVKKSEGDNSVSMNNEENILEDPIDLSGLAIPGMEDLGEDLQGGDLDIWLEGEDVLHDDDVFMGGLEIPMDDLSDLKMMV